MSKLLMFDFTCTDCAKTFEDLAKPDEFGRKCECGGNAVRQIATPRIDHSAMAISDSASPGSVAHFDRLHRQQRAKEEKCFARNGDYGKRPGTD